MPSAILIAAVLLGAIVALPATALAYIGPGAGFALVSSFFVLIVAFLLALFTILTLPVRTIYLFFRRRKTRKSTRARRVIVLGFDGMDPDLCRQYMAAGKLPNLKRLGESGTFKNLATTTPSISPVAWSSFSTGVNPGKHGIFDFFTRNPRNYQPVLSSAIISSRTKLFKLGPFKFPRIVNTVKFLRKSTSFWKILGQHKIFSTVLRVPITFPPEKFYGTCLSAMCAPDLRGTQGSFTLLSSAKAQQDSDTKGTIVPLDFQGDNFSSHIPGPTIQQLANDPGLNSSDSHTLTIPVTGKVNRTTKSVSLTVPDGEINLQAGEYSDWVKLTFKIGLGKKVGGIVKFLVTEFEPDLKIYITPINIDPEQPSLPISHPFYYSICLAKLHGSFSTLGLAEDTWALNEGVIDEKAFLEQAYDICASREAAFLDNIRRSKEGLLVSVLDTTDRIQHMFFRYLAADHPANAGKDTETHKDAILDVYERSDRLTGQVLDEIDDRDILFVISDHGFKPFKWGINLNSWLWQQGYLVLKDGIKPGGQWLAGTDWSKTRAYAMGLTGIFVNTEGREKEGIVKPGAERNALLIELQKKMEDILDMERGIKPINRAIIADKALRGPYVREAPDIFPGFRKGYRISWNSAVGKISDAVVEPNTKRWSGDHCLDPDLVPGVIFSNWRIEDDDPAIVDLAPTILNIFGLSKPQFQDGKVLKIDAPAKVSDP